MCEYQEPIMSIQKQQKIENKWKRLPTNPKNSET